MSLYITVGSVVVGYITLLVIDLYSKNGINQ